LESPLIFPNKKEDMPAMNEFPKKEKHERASRSPGPDSLLMVRYQEILIFLCVL
jgi:hypothetical protein